jgi:hypothetical protein
MQVAPASIGVSRSGITTAAPDATTSRRPTVRESCCSTMTATAGAVVYETVSGVCRSVAVNLIVTAGSRRAIGTKSSVQAVGIRQVAEVVAGSSYLSQHALTAHFAVPANPATVDIV